MNTTKISVLLAMVLSILGGLWAVAQVARAPQALSEWMPSGALLYLESADFGSQLRDWNRSAVKSKWIVSKNYEEFLTTRLVLKLNEVYGEFSNAAGFNPDLNELETVAGTQTAIALYDIGRLEFVYVSRLPAAQLGQNVLTRVRSNYQTRQAGGQSYFVRQNGNRTSAFAIAGDYVLVATREDLLAGALELIQGNTSGGAVSQEAWYQDSLRAAAADTAGAIDLRLVMDLPKVIATPHFRSYWIHRNAGEFRGYSAFLAQVRRRTDVLEETRFLIRPEPVDIAAHTAAVSDLLRHIPDGAGLARLWDTTSPEFTLDLIRQKFFTAGPGGGDERRFAPNPSIGGSVGSEADLQTRIDEPPKPSLAGALNLEPLNGLVRSAGMESVLHLESSVPADSQSDDRIFVREDAAVALRALSPWNTTQVRQALTSALSSYQTVGNIGLQWRTVTSGNNTFLQWDGLTPLTIFVNGQTLWIARSPALLTAALTRAASPTPAIPAATYFARYRHRAELPPYLKLMRMLDLSDQANYSSFFSENVGSLASAFDVIDSVSVSITDNGSLQRQTVTYALAR